MDASSLPAASEARSGTGRGGGVSQLLTNLPSRGLFSSTVPSSNLGGIRVYICDNDRNPPADQVIKTDQMNILIRSLKLKKQRSDTKATSPEATKKRPVDKTADGRPPAKRAMTSSQNGSQREGLNSGGDRDYHSLTVDRLRTLLKERGLSPKGKKDELVARLRG